MLILLPEQMNEQILNIRIKTIDEKVIVVINNLIPYNRNNNVEIIVLDVNLFSLFRFDVTTLLEVQECFHSIFICPFHFIFEF